MEAALQQAGIVLRLLMYTACFELLLYSLHTCSSLTYGPARSTVRLS